jgi:hypothetical protein
LASEHAVGPSCCTFVDVSDLSDSATVQVLLADYAVADPQGKLNIVGGSLTGVGQNASTGLTLPFALVVILTVPPDFYNEDCSLEILLEDSVGNLVLVPPPAPGMPEQPIRIGQAITLEEPRFGAGVIAPRRWLPARFQLVAAFNPGLPLTAGQSYRWRVRVDDETRDHWTERFVVFAAAAGPVLG